MSDAYVGSGTLIVPNMDTTAEARRSYRGLGYTFALAARGYYYYSRIISVYGRKTGVSTEDHKPTLAWFQLVCQSLSIASISPVTEMGTVFTVATHFVC